MRTTGRRALAAVFTLSALLVAVSAAGSAGAAPAATTLPAGSYKGGAAAAALDLQVFGNGLTLAGSTAGIGHDPSAPSTGASAKSDPLLIAGNAQQETSANVTADNTSDGGDLNNPACGPLTLPNSVPIVDLATACGAAHAAIAGGNPSAGANAEVAHLGVDGSQVTGQLSAITSNVDTLVDQLNPIFSQINQNLGLDAQSAISTLLAAITNGNLVDVDLGPSSASTSFDGSKVVATADAKGATIDLFPDAPVVTPATAQANEGSPSQAAVVTGPLVTITVSEATNTVTVDAASGQPTVAFDPALVTVTLRSDLANALTLAGTPVPNPITVKPGQNQCIPLPAPLTSCITVAGGSQKTLDDGTTEADAAGVSIDLFTGLPGNGIHLGLAQTSVQGLVVVAAPAAPTTTAAPTPATNLARTGGSTPMGLVAGLLGVAFVGWVVTRRRRSVEAC